MGTEVQFKMFFPGYRFMEDINDKAGNRSLQLSCDNSTLKNGNQLNGFSRWPTSYIHFKCEKEELRKMILKQESIFRHQLHELHRLYKIQRDLMNEIKFKGLCKSKAPTSLFQPHLFSSTDKSKQHAHHCPSTFLISGRIPTSEESRIVSEPNVSSTLVRGLFDLKHPVSDYITKEDKLPPCSESGLPAEKLYASISGGTQGQSKERFHRVDNSASSLASFHERGLLNNFNTVLTGSGGSSFFGQSLNTEASSIPLLSTQAEFKKVLEPVSLSSDLQSSNTQTSRKIFGVEISQRDRSDAQLSLHRMSNASIGSNLSSMKSVQGPKITENRQLLRGSREMEGSRKMNTDEFGSFDSNLADTSKCPNPAASSIKYRIEVKQSLEMNMNGHPLSSREFLDLNVCPTEEEASSTLCCETSPIKPMRREIDLEVPVLESDEYPQEGSTDSKQGSSVMLDNKLEEKEDGLLRVAAETLVTVSSIGADKIQEQIFPDKSEDTQSEILRWFAEIIDSSFPLDPETDPLNCGEHDPEGMDYFEFATLNLVETKTEEPSYKPPVSEKLQENLFSGRFQKGRTRRGRQKRDFQRDVLPGLTSLSRSEVTEDLQTIEGLIKATGRALRLELQQRNGASKGSRARGRTSRRGLADNDLIHAPAVEKPNCQEMGIDEGALMGWGKRARRPKRPRCSVAIHSVSPEEVF